MANDERWEIFDGTNIHGPFSEDALVKTIERGMPATMKTRRVGEEKWLPIGAHEPFANALASAASSGAGRVQTPPVAIQPVIIVNPAEESWITGCLAILVGLATVAVMGAIVYACVL